MEYIKRKGNLFDLKESHILGHCIAADAIMGAGIAKQFRKEVDVSEIDNMAKDKQLIVGETYLSNNVFYTVTKKCSFGKPTRESFTKALYSMRDVVLEHDIKELALPKIGAGLDRLEWEQTEKDILEIFKDIDVKITVCEL